MNNISIDLDEKGLIFVVGPSGSGKTTLLNLIGGLDRPNQGEIILNGEDIAKYNDNELNDYRGEKIGFIFQEYNVINHLTVYENIVLSQSVLGKITNDNESDKLMASLGILELKNRRVDEISGGQRQRVAIARALLKNSKIILADEPTGALDEETSVELMNYIKMVSKLSMVIVVSHDKKLANKYADRIIELSNGIIVNDKLNDKSIKTIVSDNPSHYSSVLSPKYSKLKTKKLFQLGIIGVEKNRMKFFVLILMMLTLLVIIGVFFSFSKIQYSERYIKTMYSNDNYYYSILRKDKELMNYNQIQQLKEILITDELYPIYDLEDENTLQHILGDLPNVKFYSMEAAYGFMEINDDKSSEMHFRLVGNSQLPSNDNEVLITLYMYQYFSIAGYRDLESNQIIEINSYDDLIGKKIGSWESITSGSGLIISGIIDTNFNYEKYRSLKEVDVNETIQVSIDDSYQAYIQNASAHTLIYVNSDFFERNPTDSVLAVVTPLSGNIDADVIIFDTFNPETQEYVHIDDISSDLFLVKKTFESLSVFLLSAGLIFVVIMFSACISIFSSFYICQRRTLKLLKALGIKYRIQKFVIYSVPFIIVLISFCLSSIVLHYLLISISNELALQFGFDFVLSQLSVMTVVVILLLDLIVVIASVQLCLNKRVLN